MNYVHGRPASRGRWRCCCLPTSSSSRTPSEVLALLDGLILAGGADIDPASYGERPRETRSTRCPSATASKSRSHAAAIERDLPLLGICRGMQLINVACGGTLIQHLPDRFGHGEHRRVVGTFEGSDHEVNLVEGSLAAAARPASRCTRRSPTTTRAWTASARG